MKVNLVTGRTLDQGEGLEIGKKLKNIKIVYVLFF